MQSGRASSSRRLGLFDATGAVLVVISLAADESGARPAAVHPRPRLAGGRRARSSRGGTRLGRDARSGSPPHRSGRADRRDGRAERARSRRADSDELARLGASFNTMLASLEESLETQRRFVADASHELRTPLTSLQTNIDVLRGDIELETRAAAGSCSTTSTASRRRCARSSRVCSSSPAAGPRSRRRSTSSTSSWRTVGRTGAHALPSGLVADRTASSRPSSTAIATGWSVPSGTCSRTPASGAATVAPSRSRSTAASCACATTGPGFADEDRPLVFDRFYRSAAARSMPGAGLGLAIVREVAEAHGGTVEADNAGDGGAVVRLSLNGAARFRRSKRLLGAFHDHLVRFPCASNPSRLARA